MPVEPAEVAIPTSRPRSVDQLAREISDLGLPHALLVEAARQAVAEGDPGAARARALRLQRDLLGPVVNATGVLLHTNLGRAPGPAADGGTYTNLELDLDTGRRGSRQSRVAWLVDRLVGSEDALVVNNGAAALLLALAALAAGRPVLVSRGELVEIGGGFRIPEVLESSGARLIEVGTTNRTRIEDYARALSRWPDTGAILKVHRSNFHLSGFTSEASVAELSRLGPRVVHDAGSGLLDANVPWWPGPPPGWLAGEPGVRQSLTAGAALVTFSGDKLMGGPQAGLIVGRAELVQAAARHPLARALRPGGLILQALQATCLSYLEGKPPLWWQLAATPMDELTGRAQTLVDHLGGGDWTVRPSRALPGGGSLPGADLESVALVAEGDRLRSLRRADVPVLGRVEAGCTWLDLRTVLADQDKDLLETLRLEPRAR